jgi:hypothetical protein
MSGAHRNLKVYGKPTRLRKPMVAMSTPSALSHACIAWPVRASGRPEAKPRTVTATSRCSAVRSRRGLSARGASESFKGTAEGEGGRRREAA